jgi:tetratricopeptide (TPR) repeat protein
VSALFAALAIGALTRLLMRLGAGGFQAALAAAVIGLFPEFVLVATTPEVYSLHLLLQLLSATALLDVLNEGSRCAWMRLWWWLGLSFANHLISVWFAAPLAFVFWLKRRDHAQFIMAAKALVLFAPGLLLYAYLPLAASADPLMNQGDPDSLGRLLAHVGGAMFRYRLFTLSAAEVAHETGLWWESLRACWGLWALPLAAFGVWLAMRDPRLRLPAMAALCWMGTGIVYTINYFIPDKDGYYLLPHLLIGVFAALGAWRLAGWLAVRATGRHAGAIRAALVSSAAIFALAMAAPISRADNRSMSDFRKDVWSALPADTLMISESLPLVWATMVAQEIEDLSYRSAVVSEYYLGFKWYRDMLTRLYPSLRLPEELQRLGEQFERADDNLDGERLGNRRHALARRMVAALIEANRAERPVVVFIMDTEQEPTRFEGYPLQNVGLVYKVVDQEGKAPDHQCDFTSRYRAGKSSFKDERERYVAGLYATACNRLGISQVTSGDYQDALKSFDAALAFDPDYAQAMKNKGLVLVRYLKRVEDGKRIWRRYLELAGDDADAGVKNWLKQADGHE